MILRQLPWWFKVSAKLILSRLPIHYVVWQRLGLFRHGSMDLSEYAISVFDQHVARAGLKGSLRGKMVLELGPGDSVASAVVAATYGARAVLVDTDRYARDDVNIYKKLTTLLAKRGFQAPDLTDCVSVADILDRCDATYLTAGLQSLRQVDSNSIDYIFSHAVLEHVRRNQFLDTMRQFRRILKSDGVCSHQIDLRDHLGGALNNLRFSDKIWESDLFANAGFYTNRLQYNDMQSIFAQAGFRVTVKEVRKWPVLPTKRSRLAPQFRALSDEALLVSGFAVVLHPIATNQ